MASKALEDHATQMLICVDQNGKENGKTIDRRAAHTAPGIKHMAIQILVFNSKKELILHERPMKKVGGGVLDAPTTHVLAGEKTIEAAARCLKTEYGIENVAITTLNGYSYERDYGDGSCENEFCIAAFTRYDGIIIPHEEEAAKIINVSATTVLNDLKTTPQKYPPWFKETVVVVSKTKEGKALFS